MLTTTRASIVAASVVTGLLLATPGAHADTPKCQEYNSFGVCVIWVGGGQSDPGAGGSAPPMRSVAVRVRSSEIAST